MKVKDTNLSLRLLVWITFGALVQPFFFCTTAWTAEPSIPGYMASPYRTEALSFITQWAPVVGVTLTRVSSTDVKLSGSLAPNGWVYATAPLGVSKFECGATYRLEGWMKVESLSDKNSIMNLKLVALDRTGRWVDDYRTFAYALSDKNDWQKLWVEIVADDRFDHGYIAIDGGTSRSVTAAVYVREVVVTKVSPRLSYAPDTYVTHDKLNDVFWPYKKSDVIAFTTSNLRDYTDFGVDFVSWGGHPEPTSTSVNAFCGKVNNALKAGTKIAAKIGIRSDFAGFINLHSDKAIAEAQCKDLFGRPFVVPDSPSVRVRGYPAYWFSVNSVLFRKYLKDNAERAMLCHPQGLTIDDPMGDAGVVISGNGEYSYNGVIGFRNYMKSNFSTSQLFQKGISDIEAFDIKAFHQLYANVGREYRPFRKELIDFQLSESASAFREIRSVALRRLNRRVPVGANLDPAYQYGGRLLTEVDYFSFECDMNASTGKPYNGRSLLSYKMADALKRPAVLMGSGSDHAYIKHRNLPGMIRAWVAEAYAFGNYFVAPYHLWAYSETVGPHSYKPRSNEELAPMYQFVKNNRHLFDNYHAIARTALVVSYAAYTENRADILRSVMSLARENIPFEIVIAGDNILGIHLSRSQLARYDNFVLPPGSMLSIEDAAVLAETQKLIVSDPVSLDRASKIKIRGTAGIRANLTGARTNNTKPIVVHILNEDYDVNTDCFSPKKNFVVVLPTQLLGGTVTGIKYVRPPSWKSGALSPTDVYPDKMLDFTYKEGAIEVLVPHLDLWGILAISLS